MKKLFVALAVAVASITALAFSTTQTEAEVTQEINERVLRGETLEQVAIAAREAGIPIATFLAAFTASGRSLDLAVASAVGGGYVSGDVIEAAVARGGDRTAMTQIALASLPETAAGDQNQNLGGTDVGGNRSATIGGATGNVSPS